MPSIGIDEIFRVGGFVFSRTSVSTFVDGVPYTGITEVSFEESREGEIVHGQRSDGSPLGLTSGLYLPGAFTFKALVDTGTQLEQQLAVLGLGSYGNYLFNFTLEIFENLLLPSLTLNLSRCKIEKKKFGLPTDASGLQFEYECKFLGATGIGEGIGLAGLPSILSNISGITNGL